MKYIIRKFFSSLPDGEKAAALVGQDLFGYGQDANQAALKNKNPIPPNLLFYHMKKTYAK